MVDEYRKVEVNLSREPLVRENAELKARVAELERGIASEFISVMRADGKPRAGQPVADAMCRLLNLLPEGPMDFVDSPQRLPEFRGPKLVPTNLRSMDSASRDGSWVNLVFKCRWDADKRSWDQIALAMGWVPDFTGAIPDYLADMLVNGEVEFGVGSQGHETPK